MFMLMFSTALLHCTNDCTWYNICSTWFLYIRIYLLVPFKLLNLVLQQTTCFTLTCAIPDISLKYIHHGLFLGMLLNLPIVTLIQYDVFKDRNQ